MKQVSFMTSSRKIISFRIEDRIVTYFDDIWDKGIQILPKKPEIMLQLIKSRNKDMKAIAALIMDANKGKNLEEYESCKTEQELADFISKECEIKGLLKV